MPAVLFLFADSNQDTGWFTGFENSHDLVGLSFAEIGFDKFVAPTFGCFQNRSTPLLGTVGDPALKLLGDLAQYITAHRVLLAVGGKEPNHRKQYPVSRDVL